MRIQSHLCRKNLYQYCENLQESFTAPQTKKRQEAADLIIQYMDNITFESIVTLEIETVPYLMWQASLITTREESGSTSSDIKTYIKECQRLMNQLAIVYIDIPDDVLSYTILAKLHTRYNHHVDAILMNENMIKNPNQVLLKISEVVHIEEARKRENLEQEAHSATAQFKPFQKGNNSKSKPEHPCSPGKHNELTNYRGTKVSLSTAAPESENDKTVEAHLSGTVLLSSALILPAIGAIQEPLQIMKDCAQDQPTGTVMFNSALPSLIKKMVLDSGATHHIINSSAMMFNITPCSIKIVTGNAKQVLNAEGIGSANLINKSGQTMTQNDCLDITMPDSGYDRRPTNRDKKLGLNEGQFQWVVVIRGDLLAGVYPKEAQADRLGYDLRGWEPVE
ncbi:hypothetical protein PPACK8108_LOCUS19381 [Phakopsora pachyrhizi]|uniref:Retrovirus-related Pol polyprotein from transposon TNT 1-94-like beta-barrel domain-containing protein n=1 Tax=Phakopsora pachyrhizi TaxID=170000 RepID=A0AAV0BEW6_PHAPC|nr:hypothetical protein PPACK8108_LOCUS19381 [Phakopsora pachyrhizi]